MAKPTKKSAGPFVLWPELTRDDSYQLRTAFNPDKAEYVAHVEDGIDLDTVPLASDTLPDLEAQTQVSPSRSPANRKPLRILAGVSLTILGVLAAAMVLRNRPSELPGDTEESVQQLPAAVTSSTVQQAASDTTLAPTASTSATSPEVPIAITSSTHPVTSSMPAHASTSTRGESLP